MIYRLLADLILVLHLAFIVFVVAGGLLALRWRWAPLVHLPAAFWGAFIVATGGICPLTPLENMLRRAAGEAGYPGGFIENYLLAIIYPAGLTPQIQLILAVLVIVANVLAYSIVRRRRRKRRSPGPS